MSPVVVLPTSVWLCESTVVVSVVFDELLFELFVELSVFTVVFVTVEVVLLEFLFSVLVTSMLVVWLKESLIAVVSFFVLYESLL